MAKKTRKKLPVKKIKVVNSDEHLGKTVEIKCEGAGLVELDSLTDFQGKLKTLSDESYERLKQSILSLGFSFPIAAWKNQNKTFILDAHQRVNTLRKMREDGYLIPKLPVVWVQAKSRQDAAKKLLAATSQYGEITYGGLHEFMVDFKIDIPVLASLFQFPEIDMPRLVLDYFQEEKEVSFKARPGSKDMNEQKLNSFDHQCPKCGFKYDEE